MSTQEELELGRKKVQEHEKRMKAIAKAEAERSGDGIDPTPVTITSGVGQQTIPVGAAPVIPAGGFPVAVQVEDGETQNITAVRRAPSDEVQVMQNQTTEEEAEVIAAQNAIAAKVEASKQAIAEAAAKQSKGKATVEEVVKSDAKLDAANKKADDLRERKDEGKVEVKVDSAKGEAKPATKGEADLDALLKG